MNIKIVCFDADDTLWVNEPNYRETERKFAELLSEYLPAEDVINELYKVEMQNLSTLGYGAKAFIISMIDTAIKISGNNISSNIVNEIILLGKQLINKPLELLDGVEETLTELFGKYKLVLATKGDLLDQERKINNSGLKKYFSHIEIMSNKKEEDYQNLWKKLNIAPNNFLMIGNSMKSDILPVLNAGAYAIYVPCDTNWVHEIVDFEVPESDFFRKISQIKDIITQHLL